MTGKLTLLDLAQRTGSDATIGLIEDVVTYSPEFELFPVRPIPGISYMLTRRIGLPPSGFRDVNGGVNSGKSQYVQETKQMYFLDAHLEVDEAIVKGDPRQIGDVLTDEATGILESTVLTIGSQVWYGTAASAKGFTGLDQQIADDTVYAGGTANTCSAYLVNLDLKGVHLDVGNDGDISLPEWKKQQLTKEDGTKFMGYVTNLSSYLGLAVASQYSVYRVRGIDATHPLTDQLAAKVLANIPQRAMRRGNWRWFMNTAARWTLQNSRTAIGQVGAGPGGGAAWAPAPTELAGIPITVTDSLLSTETTTAS